MRSLPWLVTVDLEAPDPGALVSDVAAESIAASLAAHAGHLGTVGAAAGSPRP